MAAPIDVGRVVMKIAGREAGKLAVIVEKHDTNFVTIDGQCKRRRCNIDHIEFTPITVDIKKGASHEEVTAALKKQNIETPVRVKKQPTERPQSTPQPAAKPQKEKAAAPKEAKEKPAPKKKVN